MKTRLSRYLASLHRQVTSRTPRCRSRSQYPQQVDVLEQRTLLSATVGVYDENVIQPNHVDFTASRSTVDQAQFAANVSAAFQQDLGGVIDATELNVVGYTYGRSQNKSLNLVRAEGTNYGIGGTSLNPNVESISETGAFVSTADGGFNFTSFQFEVNGAVSEQVVEFGLTALSHTGRDYGTVWVLGRLDNNISMSASRVINANEGAGDTFFGLTAPVGRHFVGFDIRYSAEISQPLWFDDIGFRTEIRERAAVVASIQDSNSDGQGDLFNASPFTGLLRQVNGQEDRAIAEFDLSRFQSIESAVLDFELAVNNGFGGGTRAFNVYVYSGNGQADLADYSAPGTIVGTVELVVSESRDIYQLNVTSELQSVLASQSQFAGVRVDPVNDSSPSVLVNPTLKVNGAVTSENNPPRVNGQSFVVNEDAAAGSIIDRVVATDPDPNQSLTFAITSGNEAGLFAIDPDSGDLSIAAGARLDFETARRHVLIVTATDNGTPRLSGQGGIAVNVRDVNDVQPVVRANQTFVVPEDAANGTSVGIVVADDVDTVGTLQDYVIESGNDNGTFAINPVTGEITVADTSGLDFDAQASHMLGVRVSDGVQLSDVQFITIVVEPLPAFTALTPSVRASIHDQQQDGTGDLFNDSPFEGLLRQQSGFREDRAIAEFDVSGQGAVTGGTLDFTLHVNNSLGTTNRHFDVFLYAGNGQADLSDYSITGLRVGTVVLGNFGSIDYSLDVAAELQTILASGASFVGLRVDPVNDSAPSILGSAVLKVNLAPTLAPITAPDPVLEDSGTHSLALSGISAGGREDQLLSVVATTDNPVLLTDLQIAYNSPDSTAVLSYTPAADQNGVANVTVTVRDAGPDGVFGSADDGQVSQSFQVVVLPVNDPPQIPDGQIFTVDEHAAAGTQVAIVTVDDAEGDPVDFAIEGGNEAGAFAIDAKTGRITVADSSALDYEAKAQYILRIRVADAVDPSLGTSADVVINVTDMSEPGIVIEPGDGTIQTGRKAQVSVAILSTASFDPATDIDVSSLTLEVGGITLSPEFHRKKGYSVQFRDINGDGRNDMLIVFDAGEAALQPGEDLPVILRGRLGNGSEFSSHSSVDVVESRRGNNGKGNGKGNGRRK